MGWQQGMPVPILHITQYRTSSIFRHKASNQEEHIHPRKDKTTVKVSKSLCNCSLKSMNWWTRLTRPRNCLWNLFKSISIRINTKEINLNCNSSNLKHRNQQLNLISNNFFMQKIKRTIKWGLFNKCKDK